MEIQDRRATQPRALTVFASMGTRRQSRGPAPFTAQISGGLAPSAASERLDGVRDQVASISWTGWCHHRFKAYPLKDAAGRSVPETFLFAVEEAATVTTRTCFVLGNAAVAP